jgi:hypothetical protein
MIEQLNGYRVLVRPNNGNTQLDVIFQHLDKDGNPIESPGDAKVVLRLAGNRWISQEYTPPKQPDIRLKKDDYIKTALEIAPKR